MEQFDPVRANMIVDNGVMFARVVEKLKTSKDGGHGLALTNDEVKAVMWGLMALKDVALLYVAPAE